MVRFVLGREVLGINTEVKDEHEMANESLNTLSDSSPWIYQAVPQRRKVA